MVYSREQLFHKCLAEVNKQIERYQERMDRVKESMDVNDVHTDYDREASKGQLLNDFETYTRYLDNAQRMKQDLNQVSLDTFSEDIRFGSVVETSDDYYFVATGLGDIEMPDGSTVHVISTDAPVFEKMEGKKEGETFTIDGKEHKILEVG